MSEHIWEEIVQDYLTTNRSVLVSRQYEITDEHDWNICPDLLAIDFATRQIWFVEVTAGSNADKIAGKSTTFQTEVVPRLRKQLAKFAIVTDDSGWRYGLWAFVREKIAESLRAKIVPHVELAKVSALEDIACPWEYWEARRKQENISSTGGRAVATS